LRVFLTILFYLLLTVVWFRLLYCSRCMISRLLFLARLKRTVKRRGGTVRIKHFPLRAFFSVYGGEDVTVRLGDGTAVSLKFFPFFLKRKSVVLYDEREMRVQKQSTLFSGKTYFGFMPRGVVDLSDLHRMKKKKYSCAFSDAAENRIMLFSPAPLSMRAVTGVGNSTVLDNGVSVYHFKTYTEGGFLHHLRERLS